MLSKVLFKTGSRITIVAPLSLIPKRFFSEQKNSDAEETDDEKDLFEGDHSKYSEKEKQLIKAYEDSPVGILWYIDIWTNCVVSEGKERKVS